MNKAFDAYGYLDSTVGKTMPDTRVSRCRTGIYALIQALSISGRTSSGTCVSTQRSGDKHPRILAKGEPMRFGIPYAYGEINDGRLYRVCPVCGEKLPEETDLHGEETTTNYAEHYEAKHTAVCGCGTVIAQSPKDRAWEDESGACGCGNDEHEPEDSYGSAA